MRRSALRLETYFLEDVGVRANLACNADVEAADPEVATQFLLHPDDAASFQVVLSLTQDDDRQPYTYHLTMRGFFRFNGETAPNKKLRDQLITNSGPTLLYGAARDILLGLSARGPFQPILLPSVVFQPMALETEGGQDDVPPSEDASRSKTKRRKKNG